MNNTEKTLYYNCILRRQEGDWNDNAAFIVNEGVIEVTGESQAMQESYSELPQVDLEGKTVTAGFNDAHLHLYQLGRDLNALDLSDVKDLNDLEQTINQHLKSQTDQEKVIRAIHLHDQNFPKGVLPTRFSLDKITTQPLIIFRACYHAAALNTAALNLAGIDRNTSAPPSGKISRGESGKPDGRLYDSALGLIEANLPNPTAAEVAETMKIAGDKLLAEGITSVGTDDLTALNQPELMMKAYHHYISNSTHPRLWLQQRINSSEEIRWLAENGYKTGTGDTWLLHGPLKIMLDGSLGAKTAALTEPYQDDENNYGDLLLSQETLTNFLQQAGASFTAAIHTIGDRAIETALQALSEAAESGFDQTNSYLIHCQLTTPGLIQELGRRATKLAIQPTFVSSDWSFCADHVGQSLADSSYAWKSLEQAGALLAGSSDAPIEPTDPLIGIQAAVTRQDQHGSPKDGWHPEEKLGLDKAWEIFTNSGAIFSGEESKKGHLLPGQLADFIILSEDPRQVEPNKLNEIQVLATYLEGKKVYSG
ncbi:MAG: amidohydrolase [Bacillota bacterium]